MSRWFDSSHPRWDSIFLFRPSVTTPPPPRSITLSCDVLYAESAWTCSFQIHLRKYWNSRYSAMEPNEEVTRMLQDAHQGPSSGSADGAAEDEWACKHLVLFFGFFSPIVLWLALGTIFSSFLGRARRNRSHVRVVVVDSPPPPHRLTSLSCDGIMWSCDVTVLGALGLYADEAYLLKFLQNDVVKHVICCTSLICRKHVQCLSKELCRRTRQELNGFWKHVSPGIICQADRKKAEIVASFAVQWSSTAGTFVSCRRTCCCIWKTISAVPRGKIFCHCLYLGCAAESRAAEMRHSAVVVGKPHPTSTLECPSVEPRCWSWPLRKCCLK